ncbi:PAS domain-containing protein [Candidatus Saccharibacteria bacterium]|nr:PAS domain-containing protein [Candidatus Saccharibacteria bacterium]
METASAEHEQILTIINNLADAVFSIDMKGIIRLYNASGLNLLDTNASVEGKHVDDIFNLEDENGKKKKIFSAINKTHSVTVNDSLRMRSGDDVMRIELTYAPIRSSYSATDPSGTSQGYILIARDVTRLKSLEEERDEFISVVSHELRTPVTVAEGTISNAQLMLERNMSDKKKLEQSLEEAHEQVIYLAKMVNDLSTLSRAERGISSESERINVAELAHDLYGEYHGEAEKSGLHFDLALAPHVGFVNTSRLYLHELLQNFITNSIKYTKEGSITLKIRVVGPNVRFEVIDTGIGISKSDQARIFEKFYRSEDYRTRETNGTGLGLYVTRKLSKKMNTEISVTSRLNFGSTFSFEIPLVK